MEENCSLLKIKLNHSYSSLETDISKDVVVPLLKISVSYDRGVGFFTSGWLKKVTKGLLHFVKNNGKARIITSTHLQKKDWDIISSANEGDRDKLIVQGTLKRTLKELEDNLEHDTLAALAWLIRDGILEFRFAIPKKELEGGIFHSKTSVFLDSKGNGVILHGSENDSKNASINEESISVYTSFGAGKPWYDEHKNRFEKKWNRKYKNLRILKIEDAEKDIIIRHTERYDRPYQRPSNGSSVSKARSKKPDIYKEFKIRDYQQEAISEWRKNDSKGIFEMATGTGKTLTAIAAAIGVYKKEGRIALIILVPYIHLVDQWVNDLLKFRFEPICCYESVNKWKTLAGNKIREFNAGLRDNICLVSTHKTSSMESFTKITKRIHKPILIIGDEIHELGAKHYRNALTERATLRIGLSATPDRWFDDEGTSILRGYFGDTVIKYELNKAINEGHLTPYKYYPEKIDLTEEEIDRFKYYSKIIAQEYSSKSPDINKIENMLRKRSDLIGRAENKIPHLLRILSDHRQQYEMEGKIFQHLLFYCNKGTHKEILAAIDSTGLRVHEFVHDVSLKDRQKVLKAFENGDIDGLVAIRCLDQGVDVPATRQAYVLASSTNPREFVQRRGRILRKSGKTYAVVNDFIVGPWNTISDLGNDAAKKLILRELPRFAEFSLDAQNAQEARDMIWECIETLDLIPYLRKRPWDVYKEFSNY